MFYGPNWPCFCQKEKNNDKESPIGYLKFVFSLLLLKDKLSLLFISMKQNFKRSLVHFTKISTSESRFFLPTLDTLEFIIINFIILTDPPIFVLSSALRTINQFGIAKLKKWWLLFSLKSHKPFYFSFRCYTLYFGFLWLSNIVRSR